jgi:hypothetical protein
MDGSRVEAHLGAVEAHLRAVEAHPSAMKAKSVLFSCKKKSSLRASPALIFKITLTEMLVSRTYSYAAPQKNGSIFNMDSSLI